MKHLQSPPQADESSAPNGSHKRFAIIAISVFLSLLTLPMLLWGVLKLIPNGTAPFEVAMQENRNPAQMPEKLDLRTLTADLEAYFNDRIPFRSLLISTHQSMINTVEKPYKEQLRPYLIELFYGNTPTTPPPVQPPIDLDNDLIFGGDEEETTGTPPQEPVDTTLPPPLVEHEGVTNCAHVLDRGEQIAPATCKEDGWGKIRRSCSLCDYTVIEFTAKSEHQMEKTQHLEPTCLADGVTVQACKTCKKEERTTLKGGHVGSLMRSVAPSYADYGFRLHKCDRCSGEYRTDIVDKLYDTSPFPLTLLGGESGGNAVEGRSKWLFYTGNNSLGYYQNTNPMTEKQMQSNASILQELHLLCQAQGKELHIMLMPNKEQIYWEYMPTLEITPGTKRTQAFVDYVKANTEVSIVYPYRELMSAKPYWQVYSRLDTHWNAAGGFVGVQALYRAMGMETVSMYDLPIVEDNSQTLSNSDLINIGRVNAAAYGEDTDYIITYKPHIKMLSEKGGFETGDISITTSDSPNQCNFVMLSDSFRKNMVPFLKKDFSNALFTHRDKIGNSTVIQAIKDADIIVIAAVERTDMGVVNTAKEVIKILRQNQP